MLFRGCGLRCLLHHILSLIAYTFRENRKFVFITIVQFMMSANIRKRFGLQIVFVCLYCTPTHYHHWANLSEDIGPTKCLSDIFCWVCEYDYAYFLSYSLYNMWGCVFSVYPFPLWWLKEYIYFVLLSSSNRKYELFRVGSWNNGVRCMSFYIPNWIQVCLMLDLKSFSKAHAYTLRYHNGIIELLIFN